MGSEKQGRGRTEAKRIADLVQQAIDDGATTVEEIHKRIAAVPIAALERTELFGKKALDDVRRIQDASLGAVYDAIRDVNREVGKLAKELLSARLAIRKPAARAAATKSARKSAGKRAAPSHAPGAHAN
ncbi:hypothetical protein MYXO_01824 [Myxococcaceae bacterium]|nr:hypothetical protein MYXO_01824 [Myxococcaceae bacterium]